MATKRLIVIGGVAAGTKAASKAKREDPDLEVLILTREKDISYAGCGLPYYIGGVIRERKELVVKTPEDFAGELGIQVLTECEVTKIDPLTKTVTYRDKTREIVIPYDYLVLATGASPVLPKIRGWDLQNIHTLRTVDDAAAIRRLIDAGEVREAVVVGAGFIGLEAAENLHLRGLQVTVVEVASLILPGYDEEISLKIKNYLLEKGLDIRTGVGVTGFKDEGSGKVSKVQIGEEEIPAQLVIWAGGVKPNVALAREAGIEIGPTGAIAVNEYQETNIPRIYAAGDCAETTHLITKEKVWLPMGSTANKTGRIVGLNLAKGRQDCFPGVLGTSIVKLFDLQAARTGLTEKQAVEKGYAVETVIVPGNDRAHYYPGYRQIITKLIADRTNGRLLGAQIIGEGVVDKPIDTIATAISFGGTLDEVSRLDLAYAPPFAMAMNTTIQAANVLRNKITGTYKGINPRELKEALAGNEVTVLDVRTEAEHFLRAIPGSLNIPLHEVEARKDEIPTEKDLVIACRAGKRAYLQQNRLKKIGCKDFAVLDGGIDGYCYELC